jgi:hypothetical protein
MLRAPKLNGAGEGPQSILIDTGERGCPLISLRFSGRWPVAQSGCGMIYQSASTTHNNRLLIWLWFLVNHGRRVRLWPRDW